MLDRDTGLVNDFWNGPRWRWWSLVAGVLLIPGTALVALVVALALSEQVLPLILLLLAFEILIVSVVGSGVLDSMSGRMNRGGLAREATDFVETSQSTADLAAREDERREAKERRTIRSGLIALPLIVAFVFLMTQL